MASAPQSAIPEPAIRIEHLVKRFGSLRAVDDLTFDIAAGETFGLIGPNGSGKTTLIRLLLGLLAPNSGQVYALGRKMPNRRVAAQIGYMTQSSALYNELSIRENLAFFGKLYGLRGRAAADAHRGDAAPGGPERAHRRADQHALRRHAPARLARQRADPPATPALPRRADRRHRPRAAHDLLELLRDAQRSRA